MTPPCIAHKSLIYRCLSRTEAKVLPLALAFIYLTSCSDDPLTDTPYQCNGIEFSAVIDQQNVSRADDNGFADGDRMGVFAVVHPGGTTATLTADANHVSNVALTYQADKNTWLSATDLYWPDSTTPLDFYAYYPFNNSLNSVDAYPFEVRADQNSPSVGGDLGGYEASDFLWAKAESVASGTKVSMTLQHRMAGVRVVLSHGTGVSDIEWAKLSKSVTVDNVVRRCNISLHDGVVTATGDPDRNIVAAVSGADTYRAIVAPQKVNDGSSIIGITIDKKPYNFKRSGGMNYTAGKLHTFNIKVDKLSDGGDYTVSFVNEEITPWLNDEVSHQFESNSYFVVDCPKEGTLIDCIKAAYGNGDYTVLKNLKITGFMNEEDFNFIRAELKRLSAINLQDVKLKNVVEYYWENGHTMGINYIEDDILPREALHGIESLRRIILPETMKRTLLYSLSHLRLHSTLVLPEALTHIEARTFESCSEDFDIELPSKIEYIDDLAFYGCQSHIIFNVPSTIKRIGNAAFFDCRNLCIAWQAPEGIELGQPFEYAGGEFTGDIVVPNSITELKMGMFPPFPKGVRMYLHDGITKLDDGAMTFKFNNDVKIPESVTFLGYQCFYCAKFINDGPRLPKGLKHLSPRSFMECNLGGDIEIPEAIDVIPGGCFSGTQIKSVKMGKNVQQIDDGAFDRCGRLQKVELGKFIDVIGDRAFASDWGLQTVVCLAKTPPTCHERAFEDCPMDKIILEVPEASVPLYRNDPVWGKFANITAHRELAVNIPSITCLEKGMTRTGVVRSEGEWEVASAPSWVKVTPTTGMYKEEVTITVQPNSEADREGNVVFRLKGRNYTTSTTIKQVKADVAEDKEITLSNATSGFKEIPLFIVGEGFDAQSIVSGKYMTEMRKAADQFFELEPYKTYKNYFTVSTAVACSPNEGLMSYTNNNQNKFNTFLEGGIACDVKAVTNYAKTVSAHITDQNLSRAMIIVVTNSDLASGTSPMSNDYNIAFCPLPSETNPLNSSLMVHRHACGEAFAKLGTEEMWHYEFQKQCHMPCCLNYSSFMEGKSKGWYENLSISNRMTEVPWHDFIFHPKYCAFVDVFEGGYGHHRGIYRSENTSVMSTGKPYFNTISRYAIYKRIMMYAGRTPSFTDFVTMDKIPE